MRVAIDSRANPLGGGVQRAVDVCSLQAMRISENEDEKGAQAEGNSAMGTSTICSSALSHPFRPLKIYVCSRSSTRSFLTKVKVCHITKDLRMHQTSTKQRHSSLELAS
jgi:hypothetical protein